jgi:hypothetical protein
MKTSTYLLIAAGLVSLAFVAWKMRGALQWGGGTIFGAEPDGNTVSLPFSDEVE